MGVAPKPWLGNWSLFYREHGRSGGGRQVEKGGSRLSRLLWWKHCVISCPSCWLPLPLFADPPYHPSPQPQGLCGSHQPHCITRTNRLKTGQGSPVDRGLLAHMLMASRGETEASQCQDRPDDPLGRPGIVGTCPGSGAKGGSLKETWCPGS